MPVWDISAMASDSNTSGALAGPWGVTAKPNGLRVYTADRNTSVYQYDATTSLDLTSLSAAGNFNASAQVKVCNDVEFNDDGTKMYILDQGNGLANSRRVWQYTLSTAYDVTSASYASKSLIVDAQSTGPQHINFSPDGSKLYMAAGNPATVFRYDLSTPWDVSTATFTSSFTTALGIAGGVFLRDDGTRMWVHQTTGGVLQQYDLSTPWDETTATTGPTFGFNPYDTSPRDIYINPTGEKLVMVGTANGQAWRFTLGVAGGGLVVGFITMS